MAVFSGNPADRQLGAAPGSVAEAARAGTSMTNGVSRGTPASSLGRDMGDRGFRTDVGGVRVGSMKDQGSLIGRAAVVNTGGKGNYLGTPIDRKSGFTAQSLQSTGPVPRNLQKSTVSAPPARMTSIQDYNSIVPGRVEFTNKTVPFGEKNPSLAKYLGGTQTNPVNVSVEEAKKMAGQVSSTGAYVSGANWAAQMGLPKSVLSNVGTLKKGYNTTTVKAGPAVVDISYPKSIVVGREGTFVPAPRQSTGPVPRGIQPRSSTGPVPRNVSPAPRMSTGPVPRNIQTPRQTTPTVKQTVAKPRVASRVLKDGYSYTRVDNKLQNFGAAKIIINKDINRNRNKRNKKNG